MADIYNELENTDEQENSALDGIFSVIEEHPKEAGVGAGLAILALIGLNIKQWFSGKKEAKRHLEAESLQKEVIRKQDAEIKENAKSAEKVKQLEIVNDALVQVIEDYQEKDGGCNE